MAKTKISEFSTTPGNNTDINGINIAEGCAPSGINNAIRELMSDLKEWQSGAMDVYVIPQGTAAAPGIQLYGDLDTGLYGFAANQLGVAVGGASAGYFSSAGWVGNVNGTITGDINATTIDTTNIEVTNIKAKDGTAAITIADSTGVVSVSTQLAVDNLNLSGNTLSSSDTNGNIILAPNGTGDVYLDADTIRVGDSNTNVTITSNGTADLILNTNSGTNSGSITIEDGVNGNIIIAPNGTGQVQITNAALDLTTIEVSNINAKDGTAAITIADSTGAVGISTAVTMSATTQNIALGTSQTTGTFTVGGASQTGALTLDQSTKTHTLNLGTGATESGLTKTINLGTGGVATSTTAITIGSTNGTTTTLNGTVTAATLNSTTIDTTNIEVTNIKAKDGSASATIADSTGVMTIASSVLTTTDINGGTIDGTTIGGSTAAAGTFTTATATTGNITTVNATTVDTTNIEVTNIKAKDGTAALSIADSTGVVSVSANPVLSGGTANGVVYLNASKVATSGTALVFDGSNLGLGVTPSVWNANNKSVIQLQNTSNIFTRSTGLFATSNFVYNSADDGKFQADGYGVMYQQNQTTGAHVWLNTANNTSGAGATASAISAMTLDASGNLLVGTTSSAYSSSNRGVIEVNGTTDSLIALKRNNTNNFYLQNASDGVYINNTAATPTVFNVNGSERARITSGGNFYIGTATGGGPLQVKTSNGNWRIEAYSTGTKMVGTNSADNAEDVIGVQGNPIAFLTQSTERARITSGGYFKASNDGSYINATATYHELVSNSNGDFGAWVRNTNATSPYGMAVDFSGASPNNSTNVFIRCGDSTAVRFYMYSNGGLANYQANDSNLSDQRVKKDIVAAPSYWDKIKDIEIVHFKYKDQTHDDNNVGVIAQQVEQVAPEFVNNEGWGETPEDGIPLKSIYTSDMYHAAIKTLQEAMARIEKLEAEVAALKGV